VIAGASNSSGASQTTLLTTAGGASFTLKNTTNGQTGQFGWSSGLTGPGRGIYGRADSPDGFGVDAYNSGTASGGGAALRARSDKNDAIVATASGCTGFLICGSYGVRGQGYFFGAGVYGDGTGSFAGLQGSAGTGGGGWAVYATSSEADLPATFTSNSAGTGIQAEGVGAIDTSAACSSLYCFGVVGTGDNGIGGWAGGSNGVGVYGLADGATALAVYANGDARVEGDFTVAGTCTGCGLSIIAKNGSSKAIPQGTAVTVTGVATAPDGSIAVVVDVAKGNDTILGIADVSMAPAASGANLPKSQSVHKTKYGDVKSTSAARPFKDQLGNRLVAGGTSAKAGGYLRVVTSGVFAFKAAAPSAAVGDTLAVGATAGKLSTAGATVAKGATAGKYLGTLKDGRIVLLVSPY
jgi:hypothetical protein